MDAYVKDLRQILNAREKNIFKKLSTPRKVQEYLDRLPINFELRGDTAMSPRLVMREHTAHCFEGALFAAAAFAYHGKPPLLMDLRATAAEDDHVVALFRVYGFWGAISKTNHASLRYRDPIYASVRELAMSYVHEYVGEDDRTAMREYSAPFDLRRYAPEKWVTAEGNLKWLADTLDRVRHFPAVPKGNISQLRKVSRFEERVSKITEWNRRGTRNQSAGK